MNATRRPVARAAAWLTASAFTLIAVTAGLVWALGAGAPARELLAFRFDGPEGTPEAALEVAAANLRLLATTLVAAWVVRWRPRLRPLLDLLLGGLLGLNLATLGVALGAYGTRLLEALALHGPFELAAFALAGGAYLAARSAELSNTALALSAGSAVALLAAAALLETYVQLGADP